MYKEVPIEIQDRFAREFLESIYEGQIPSFINPSKTLKRLVRTLSKEERKFWAGSIFHPSQYTYLPLRKRVKTAIRTWVREYDELKGCPFEYCGFTFDEFKNHIESQFKDDMSWDNWGEWHVDHIIPRCLFNKPYSKEQIFGLKNLQPLSRKENMAKGSKHG